MNPETSFEEIEHLRSQGPYQLTRRARWVNRNIIGSVTCAPRAGFRY